MIPNPHVAVLGSFPAEIAASLVEDADTEGLESLPHEGGSSIAAFVAHAVRNGRHRSVVTLSRAYSAGPRRFGDHRFAFHIAPRRKRHEVRSAFREERRHIVSALNALGPDVVHANWTSFYAMGALDSGIPSLVTVRDHAARVLRYAGMRYLGNYLYTLVVLKKAPFLTAVSPHIARYAERISGKTVAVIPNCISDELAQRATQAVTSGSVSPSNRLVVSALSAARLKNAKRAVGAFFRVRQQVADAQYGLVGPGMGPDDALSLWAQKEGLCDGITFHGPMVHSRFLDLLSGAAVLFHPSLEESFGNPLIEGMAMGKTVIAGATSGGCPWVMDDGRGGVLVDVRSEQAMSEVLADVLRRPQAYATQRQRAMQLIQTCYAPGTVADQYSAMYERVLTAR